MIILGLILLLVPLLSIAVAMSSIMGIKETLLIWTGALAGALIMGSGAVILGEALK